jgi:6-phosphofructokinase 1
MGRSAGWLTLYGGIAGGADMILLPEIKFNYDSIMTFLRERKKNNRHYAVIAVAEAAAAEGESPIYKKQRADEENLFGGGLVPHIADVIETLGQDEFEVRTVVLGHLQRGGSPNAEDRILSERFGEGAVRAILDEKFGHMVALQADKIVTVPIEEAVKEVRHVDPNGELVTMAKNVGISFGE